VGLVNLNAQKKSIPHLIKVFITSASTSAARIATSALSDFFSPNRLPTLSSQNHMRRCSWKKTKLERTI
jgi:hypothetical protein